MKLRHLPYCFFIILFSCVEPTLVPDKDCNDVIGGDALVDDCGHCTGGTTATTFNEYLGCDSTCQGKQFDCAGECDGNAKRDCNDVCNGTHHLEYFCEESDSSGIALDLSTRTLTCVAETLTGNCNPSTDSCDFVDCEVDIMYINTVINCQGALPECTESIGVCTNFIDSIGNMLCDSPNTNCEEFEFDGGDCDLIDCSGLHFSDELCVLIFGQVCTETEGDNSALGDGFCDDGNDDVLPVNFNCEKWGFDGAECICEDENNGEYDCWVKTSSGNYDCPSEGVIRGGDCSD